jgi:hypothetical protein
MEIVKRKFSPKEFETYVAGLNLKSAPWRGKFIVLHNTAVPSLAQRPQGLKPNHIDNLKSYYEGLGWSAGPHLFVDDHGIWAFSPLTKRGVHSPSWNKTSYGVEQLGNFQTEAYSSGRGAKVQANTIAAMAVLCHAVGIDSHTLRLHREDPNTTHDTCPGRYCSMKKPQIIQGVHDYIVQNLQ